MQGRGDYPLSAAGRAQASSARDSVVSWGATVYVASDLSRSYETALIISDAAAVLRDTRLTERDAGPWEGRPRAEMERDHPGSLENDTLRPPGFEAASSVAARLFGAFEEFINHEGLVVVVGHGATMRVVEAELAGVRQRYANLEGMALSASLEWLGRVETLPNHEESGQ